MSVGQYEYADSGYVNLTQLLNCMPDRLQDEIHSRLISLYNHIATSLTDQEKAEWRDRPLNQKTPMETLMTLIHDNQTQLDEANQAIAKIEPNQEQELLNYRNSLDGYPSKMIENMMDTFKSKQTQTLIDYNTKVFQLNQQKLSLQFRLKYLPTIL